MNLFNYLLHLIFTTDHRNVLEKLILFNYINNEVNKIKEENYVIQGD